MHIYAVDGSSLKLYRVCFRINIHALAQYLDTNSQNAYLGRFYWLIRSDTSNLASISRWEAVTEFRRDLGTVPTGKVFAKRAPVATTLPSVSRAYYDTKMAWKPENEQEEFARSRLSSLKLPRGHAKQRDSYFTKPYSSVAPGA
ncbi:hypothetical protein E4U34_001789 [Claviceps purpurea]|nr:hypothetical protein E4U34_001789 [Claviceps purpurea]